jgi:hypothetical protein
LKIKGANAPFIFAELFTRLNMNSNRENTMKPLAIIILGLMATCSVYADDKCGAAVDEADSMNVNQQGCDYSDEGLNGFLQKAFKKDEEGAVLETGAQQPLAVKDKPVLKKSTEILPESAYFSLSVEVDQWPSVALARTQLLPKAMEKCPKGFSLQSEQYHPLAMGRIELSMVFTCL